MSQTPGMPPGTNPAGTTPPGSGPPPTRPAQGASRAPGTPAKIGPYEIISELGRGGMGVVYKAKHAEQQFLVALKVVLAGEGATEEQLKRFKREVEVTRNLDHPGIVKVIESGEDGGRHWFAMELIEGRSLAEIAQTEELDWKEAVKIVRDVADALAHAHDKGILHRDIKPGNILIGEKVTKVPPEWAAKMGLKLDTPATAAEPPATAQAPPPTR